MKRRIWITGLILLVTGLAIVGRWVWLLGSFRVILPPEESLIVRHEGRLLAVNPDTGESITISDFVFRSSLSSDGKVLAFTSSSDSVPGGQLMNILDLESGTVIELGSPEDIEDSLGQGLKNRISDEERPFGFSFIHLELSEDGQRLLYTIRGAGWSTMNSAAPHYVRVLEWRTGELDGYVAPRSHNGILPCWFHAEDGVLLTGEENSFTLLTTNGSRIKSFGKLPVRPYHLRCSPDGKKIAFVVYDEDRHNSDIYVYDIENNATTRVTDSEHNERAPAWSPSSTLIAYQLLRPAPESLSFHDVHVADLSTGKTRALFSGGTSGVWPVSWKPRTKAFGVRVRLKK